MCVAPRNGQKNAHLPVRKAETGRCVWPDFEEITVHRMQYLVAGLFLLPLPARGNANFVVNPTESISAVVGDDTLVWEPPGIGSLNSLGDLVLLGHGGQVLATQTEIVAGDENSSFRCEGVSVNRETKLLDVRYRSGSSLITIHIHLRVEGATLKADLSSDGAGVRRLTHGGWKSSSADLRPIEVPYSGQRVNYMPSAQLFFNTWWDWKATQATHQHAGDVYYDQRTDGTLVPLKEQLVTAVSTDIDQVYPGVDNRPSLYVQALSGRTVVDLWGSNSFEHDRGILTQLASYGLKGCVVLKHYWQALGYDNGLPQHIPANTRLGGGEELLALSQTARQMGCLFGLHENYVDYYRNYPAFDARMLSLNGDGTWLKAWLNDRGIQAFAAKPRIMAEIAGTQSPQIHRMYRTTASFLDVNSSAWVDHSIDMSATAPDAGELRQWMAGSTKLWRFERTTHDGPVFGEGGNHWVYSGLLDGVDAEIRRDDQPLRLGAETPLFVDFDLLHIHPLQLNHGMGYYSRWGKDSPEALSETDQDAYRMQEVAYGHAAYVDNTITSDVRRVLLEDRLVSPVAAIYGADRVESILYEVGTAWVSTSEAAAANTFNRVRVLYHSGLVVYANGNPEPLRIDDRILPQFGWIARGAGILAYTARCGDELCDFAQTRNSVFANARSEKDASLAELTVTPGLRILRQTGENRVSIALSWRLDAPLAVPTQTFVHLIRSDSPTPEHIVLQIPGQNLEDLRRLSPGAVLVSPVQDISLPADLPNGEYSIVVGLVDLTTGQRIALDWQRSADRRYQVGTITLAGTAGARSMHLHINRPIKPERFNAGEPMIDFGGFKTDGLVSMTHEAGTWTMHVFPPNRAVSVEFRQQSFSAPSDILVKAPGDGGAATIKPVLGPAAWSVPPCVGCVFIWKGPEAADLSQPAKE
jgi:hypothetical protein